MSKLHIAAYGGKFEECKRQVELGVDVNIKTKYGSYTAAMEASKEGYEDIVRYLHEHGADLNIQDNNGWTALMYAVRRENEGIVKYLHQHGADLNVKNNKGETAVIEAVKHEYLGYFQVST